MYNGIVHPGAQINELLSQLKENVAAMDRCDVSDSFGLDLFKSLTIEAITNIGTILETMADS